MLLSFLIQLPSVQNYAKSKILQSLSEQYDAEWSIEDIRIKFIDEVEAKGILFRDQQGDTLFSASKLHIDIGLLSIINREIYIDDIVTDNAYVNVYELSDGSMNYSFLIKQDNADTKTQAKETAPWTFGLQNVELNNTKLNYTTKDLSIKAEQKQLVIEIDAIDLTKQIINIDELYSDNDNIAIESYSTSNESTPFSLPDLGWNIVARNIKLQNEKITVQTDPPTNITELDTELIDLTYSGDSLSTTIVQIEGDYNNLIRLAEVNGKVDLKGDKLNLQKIRIKTPTDRISVENATIILSDNSTSAARVNIDLSYRTINTFKEYIPDNIQLIDNQKLILQSDKLTYNPQSISARKLNLKYGTAINLVGSVNLKAKNGNFSKPTSIEADLNKLDMDIGEVDYILKDVIVPDSLSIYNSISASGRASGNMKTLTIDDFSLKVDEVLMLNATGIISNIGNKDLVTYDLIFNRLEADVRQIPIPKNENIAIDSLGTISYNGAIRGNTKNVKIDGQLSSDIGALDADISLNFDQGIDKLSYKGDLSLNAFELGIFLKNTELNKITMATEVDGQGIQLNDINSKLNGNITDFAFRGYTYNSININAKIDNSNINGQLDIDDPNIKLRYDGVISINEENTTFDFTADLDTINLFALDLYQDSISLSGKIESQFSLPLRIGDKEKISITNLVLSNPEESFLEDSLTLLADRTIDSTFISINGGAVDLYLEGIYSIRDLPSSINDLANKYFSTDTIIEHIDRKSQSLRLYGNVNTLRPIDIIMRKSLVQTKSISIDMNADFISQDLSGGMVIDSFFYTDFFAEKINIDTKSDNGQLDLLINATNNNYKQIALSTIRLDNTLRENKIFSTMTARDNDQVPKLKFSTELSRQDSTIQLVVQDSIILNNKDWIVNEGNSIQLQNGKIIVNDFELTDNNEYLKINSISEDGNDMDVLFDNFDIGQFVTLLTSQESDLHGNINGTMEIKDLYNGIPYYIINLEIQDMLYDSTNVGVLKVKANADPQTSLIYSEISLKGASNDVNGSGNYNTNSSEFDFRLDVNSFELMLLDPFLSEIIKESEGYLSGFATVKGTPELPDISGELTMNKVLTTIVANNSRYGIDEHTLYFDNKKINVGILDIFDAENNVATFTGNIYHEMLDNIDIDLVVETSKFTFLNTTAKENPVFYGKVMLDAVGDISGPPDLLKVDIIATSLKNTAITISPFSAESFLQEEDFITYGKPEDFQDLTNEYLLKLAQQYPFDVNLLLDANQDSELTFIVDPITGDKITGNGNGNLRIKLNPDGEQEIFGSYVVNEGSYSFSYGDFVSKDFKINQGGSVTFNGNPLNAVLDIDAVYTVYTTTYELIKNEISLNNNDISAAKARTNVDVYLSLNGTLEDPEIGLDIRVPNLKSSTLTSPLELRLNDLRNNPNELNNQVFGLLLFDSFIVPNNTSTGFGSIGGNIALSSISNLISSQLNNLAQDLIKGVDFNFNVNSYDSNYINDGIGGNVTEIGLQVTKQLFNDRLSISATGNIDLEQNTQSTPYSSFIGDFVLEYKLTEDGKYRVRVFSKTDYDRLNNENTNKNGVSLYFKKTFDSKNKKTN